MEKNYKILFFTIVSFAIAAIFYFTKDCSGFSKKEELNTAYLLSNQISKMNKIVVAEQDFTLLQKTKVSYEFLGSTISDNQIVTFTKTNAQVSYDLTKMKIKVDSINKKLIITQLPNADIRITPNVEIKSLDDSFFNRIDEKQIIKVTQEAKKTAKNKINETELRTLGRKQLSENLNQIFVLAKALNYEIVDKTNSLDINTL